jgi:hypothetical protein
MQPTSIITALPVRVVARLRAWPTESQLGARRNAMVASTVLAARRAEREDVAAYLAALTPRSQRDRVMRIAVER